MSNCELGDTIFEDERYVDFGNDGGVGSIFGEGSFTTILLLISLVTSIASMGVTLVNNKKKAVPATVNGADESDNENNKPKT